jgi:hypothetical protein
MTNLVMTEEQFQRLLDKCKVTPAPTPAPSTTPAAARLGNFPKCSSRFAGKPKEDVEAFVNAITVCKECVDISDDNALKGLPMLLNDLAATWFQGSKSLHKTWTEAVAALQNAFGKKLPPHRVFRKLFSEEQKENESTDVFVSSCRALLSQ